MKPWQLAAVLVLAVTVGWGIEHVTTTSTVQEAAVIMGPSGPVSSPDLARALSTAQGGIPATVGSGALRIALSFRAKDGELCRQFALQSQGDSASGVACHENGEWRILGLTSGGRPASTGYQMASGPNDPAINAILDKIGVTETLDRAGERDAITSGWEPK